MTNVKVKFKSKSGHIPNGGWVALDGLLLLGMAARPSGGLLWTVTA